MIRKAIITVVICLLFFSTGYAGSTKIEDRTTSGYKADVKKLGTEYGLGTSEVPGNQATVGYISTSAGTAVPLASSAYVVLSVSIKAGATNTSVVYIGDATNQYYELSAGEAIDLDINDLNKVYLDVKTSNDFISFLGVF